MQFCVYRIKGKNKTYPYLLEVQSPGGLLFGARRICIRQCRIASWPTNTHPLQSACFKVHLTFHVARPTPIAPLIIGIGVNKC